MECAWRSPDQTRTAPSTKRRRFWRIEVEVEEVSIVHDEELKANLCESVQRLYRTTWGCVRAASDQHAAWQPLLFRTACTASQLSKHSVLTIRRREHVYFQVRRMIQPLEDVNKKCNLSKTRTKAKLIQTFTNTTPHTVHHLYMAWRSVNQAGEEAEWL